MTSTNDNSLIVTENDDGTFSIEWDPKDPRYSYLNDLTEEQVTAIIEQSIRRFLDDQSLLDSDE